VVLPLPAREPQRPLQPGADVVRRLQERVDRGGLVGDARPTDLTLWLAVLN
jgi:hypothetical protein